MAYTPRTPADQNRLVEALAVLPGMIGGAEQQQPLPSKGRLATEADASAIGVTVDDIRRMMSNPSRYGELRVNESKQPAVDNAKRTKSKTKGEKPDTPWRRPPERSTPLREEQGPPMPPLESGSVWPWLVGGAAAIGGGALARKLMARGSGGVPVEAGVSPRTAGTAVAEMAPESMRTPTMRNIVAAINPGVVDAEWSDAGTLPGRAPANALAAPPRMLPAPADVVPPPAAAVADVPMPNSSSRTPLPPADAVNQTMAEIVQRSLNETTDDMLKKKGSGGGKGRGGKGKATKNVRGTPKVKIR